MSHRIYDQVPSSNQDKWTTSRLIEELSLNLATVKETICLETGNRITIHKYYHQAREKIYRIPLYRNLITFVIHWSDLTEKVRKELDIYYRETSKKELALAIKIAVVKIFENLDPEYTHTSVLKALSVRLVK